MRDKTQGQTPRFFHSKQVDPHQELLASFLNLANFAPLR
jgi:hypothetical protein